MNTIVLLVERDNAWSPESWACATGGKHISDAQITIEQEQNWLSLVRNDQVLDDFDEEERCRLVELVSEPAAYLIEWEGSSLVERLLRSIPPTVRAAVDNDHGLIVSVHKVAYVPLDSWVREPSLP